MMLFLASFDGFDTKAKYKILFLKQPQQIKKFFSWISMVIEISNS